MPELFNTGYSLCPDFGPYSETAEGPTLSYLRQRSRQWKMAIAAGFVEREGQAPLRLPGVLHARRRAPHLPQAQPGVLGAVPVLSRPRAAGRADPVRARIGFAVCADMIYRRVWDDYRDRIDLAVVSAAWPDFANRDTGRRHWLLGHVGPLSGAIPSKVAVDLGIPVIFANQCGETRTTDPRDLHRRFTIGSPARAASATAFMARPSAPSGEPRSWCSHHPPPQARTENVAYYVPLGPRGLLIGAGTTLLRIWGGLVYEVLRRRRRQVTSTRRCPLPFST